MAFRQSVVRRMFGRPTASETHPVDGPSQDPLTYILRIAGVMIMIFGIVLAGMVTLFELA